MEIQIEDIEETLRKEEDRIVLQQLRTNTKRYIEMFYDIVEKNLPQRNMQINPENVSILRVRCFGMSLKMLWRSSDAKIWWGST